MVYSVFFAMLKASDQDSMSAPIKRSLHGIPGRSIRERFWSNDWPVKMQVHRMLETYAFVTEGNPL